MRCVRSQAATDESSAARTCAASGPSLKTIFATGTAVATASGKAGAYVDAAAARLPDDVIERLTRKRKPGDPDAALDPLADPAVKAAVARSSFELLIGFQLTPTQLQYNATR